jgi:lysophospholipase
MVLVPPRLPARLVAPAALLALAVAACDGPAKQPPIDVESPAVPAADAFSAEATVDARYQTEILPAYEAGRAGTFAGAEGVPIAYRVFAVPGAKGAIVLLPGRTEPIRKHAETIADLVAQGYAVYAMDPRGQGESGRMLDDPEIGYVAYFRDYVEDLQTFVDEVVLADGPHAGLFLLAHSMGGGIGLMHVYKHPGVFDAVALSAPMIGIDTGGFPESVATALAVTSCGAGDGEAYAAGQGGFSLDSFEDNVVTHSAARYALKVALYDAHPELRMGGVSWRWLCEALTATSHLQALGDESTTPTLIFQAGDDRVVRGDAQDAYCDAAPRCQLIRYEGAFHEIFSERDDIRNHALARALRFFAQVAAEAP